jgi:hypothetical protein
VIEMTEQNKQIELTEHLRQYQHNDGSGLVFGYDKDGIDKLFASLNKQPPAEAGEGVVGNVVTLDKRDLFDFVRAEVIDALETEWTPQDRAHTHEEAYNRTEACLRKLYDNPSLGQKAIGEMRNDATTGHIYMPYWFESPPAIGTKLYTSQTAATQAAVAASLLKAAKIIGAQDVDPAFKLRMATHIRSLIPADNMQALRELMIEAMEVARLRCYQKDGNFSMTEIVAEADRILAEKGKV